jgi:pimeloyl-ACP methyl ester carboxylesterase
MKDLIVTVHGFTPAVPDYSMTILSRRLREQGDVIKVDLPSCHTRSIHEMAENIMGRVDLLKPLYRNVVMVGHSMGAVIGARILQEDPGYLRAFVGVAGPMRGHRHFNPFEWGSAASEMTRGSDLMRSLPTKSPVDSLGIIASVDILVHPKSASRYFHETQVVPRTTHLSVVLSKRTHMEIGSWLDYGIFDKDPTSDIDERGSYSEMLIPVI